MPSPVTRAVLSAAPTKAPTEFRLFRAGVNHTSKGDFVFDQAAAKSVMAAYARQGVELPIDLEHMSLSDPASATRPDAGDARGWFQLALRGGDLWAVNVRWTPDGAARLANKTQRYISPAFAHDDSNRVTEIVNAALVSMPATYNAPALVAASRFGVTSKALTARVTRSQLRAVDQIASKRKITRADVLRLGIDQIRQGKTPDKDPQSICADLAAAVGLQPDASPSDVLEAVKALLTSMVSPDASASPAPPPAAPPPGKLSREVRAVLRARGISDAEFAQMKRDAVKRA